MTIERIDKYDDARFPQRLLCQHGCFLVDDEPCSFEIISDHEAVIHYGGTAELSKLIEEFRFYTCHITTFYDSERNLVAQLPTVEIFTVALRDIQPSQFYVDKEKIEAVESFIFSADDIIIPVLRYGNRYISLDGHTRLCLAAMNGWETVKAVEDTSDEYIYGFVNEAKKRGIHTPHDMKLVDHSTYEVKWNQFCDDFFKKGPDTMFSYEIKKMETNHEIDGKGYVHYKSWQEAYTGLIDANYLENKMTPQKCIAIAHKWTDNLLVAKDGEKVVGFAGYGKYRDDTLDDCGEVFSIYVLADYYGKKIGYELMNAAFEKLSAYKKIAVWVLKGNERAIRFYERYGFKFDGTEQEIMLGTPNTELRMVYERD